ncbi:hypothetical protein F5884DRAFT_746088 [Xylogone sp. PMI_703]|nr:hypothetical protein F5884DRAFT_746088 [Xylogone sp. PMI_703]
MTLLIFMPDWTQDLRNSVYFIHVYENALRFECGYRGHLTYWNWALDWQDPTNAPVFDSELGFGGDGDYNMKAGAGEGYCVPNGPLAGLQLKYYGTDIIPHCFSRSFADGGKPATPGRLSGQKYKPEAMKNLMQIPSSTAFAGKLDSIHTAIPIGIRGEMARFSSPYEIPEPIFFLHHTQVDRIWWLWQQDHAEAELAELDEGTLNEPMDMFGLYYKNVTMRDIMTTQTSHLCYRY